MLTITIKVMRTNYSLNFVLIALFFLSVISCEKPDDSDKDPVVVIDDKDENVTGINLNTTSIELDKGATFQLTATVTPSTAKNRKVLWSSDKTSVATVDANGLVRGVSKGNVIIKAKTEEGEFEATCSVKISDGSAKTYKLTIDFPEVSDAGRGAVYVAWIEDEGGENIQNLYLCNTIKVDVAVNDKRLDGIALPYWRKEKISNTDFNNVDAITGSSIQNNFNFSRSLELGGVTKFYVCFEIDRSENGNEYFVDRPCFIYRTEQIDLSNLKSSYEFSLVAYMANDTEGSKYSQKPKKDIPGFIMFKYMEDITYISPVNMFKNETLDHSNLKVSVSEE